MAMNECDGKVILSNACFPAHWITGFRILGYGFLCIAIVVSGLFAFDAKCDATYS